MLIALGQAARNSKLDFQEAVGLTLAGGQPGTHLPLCKEKQHHPDIRKGAAAAKTKVIVSEVEEAAAQERKAGREDDPDNSSQSTISRKTAYLTRGEEKLADSSITFEHERRQRFYPSLNANHDEAKEIGADDESKQQETNPLLFDINATCDGSFHMTRMMLEPIIKHPRYLLTILTVMHAQAKT